MARGRYRCQREYPQPPPPSTSTTKRTINRVSIVFSFIWVVYSYLNSVRALFVPDLPMRGKGCVSDSFLRLSEGNEETARYKRRNSRPKGRIRFRKDPLEPTNSLTRRNCPRASFIRVYSDDKARWSNPLIFWMCYSSQFQFDDCKSLPELGRIEHVSLLNPLDDGVVQMLRPIWPFTRLAIPQADEADFSPSISERLIKHRLTAGKGIFASGRRPPALAALCANSGRRRT
jgi:hypothetical protein